jgi:radical SAM superfamily enzyme YgiQ (UPF0313 family)
MSRLKLQLIQPPDDRLAHREWTCPVGLELIAARIRDFVDVEIIDGSFMKVEEIIELMDGDYIGIQDWYTKHKNTIRLLRAAKDKGAITMVGGPNATHLAERMLKNHKCLDYAVMGDGEDAVYQLIMGGPPELINNLAYRDKDGNVKLNRMTNASINDTLFDLEEIVNLDLTKYLDKDRKGIQHAFPISGVRGCIKAELGERCTFCSIVHSLKVMKPETFWEQIDLLHQKYGLEYFHETGDSFLIGNWPKKLLAARPEHLKDIRLSIYAGVEEVTPEGIDICRQLNVERIFIGIEATDWDILERIKKPYTIERIEEVLQLIYDAGIIADIPFMYGLPGETKEAMKKTNDYIKHINAARPGISKVMMNLTVPIYGCDLFDNLTVLPEVKQAYWNRTNGNVDTVDDFDYELLIHLMITHQTDVTYVDVIEHIKEAQEIVQAFNSDISRYKTAMEIAGYLPPQPAQVRTR